MRIPQKIATCLAFPLWDIALIQPNVIVCPSRLDVQEDPELDEVLQNMSFADISTKNINIHIIYIYIYITYIYIHAVYLHLIKVLRLRIHRPGQVMDP